MCSFRPPVLCEPLAARESSSLVLSANEHRIKDAHGAGKPATMPANSYDFGPEYDQIKPTARRFGVSKSIIQQLVSAGKIESFLLRRHSDSRNGVRLIRQSSVRAFFEKQAAEYAKAKAAG